MSQLLQICPHAFSIYYNFKPHVHELVYVDLILCNKDFVTVFYHMGAIFKSHVMHAAFTSSSLYLLLTLTHMCSWLWQFNKYVVVLVLASCCMLCRTK